MTFQMTLPAIGTLGNVVGAGSDGVILGAIADANPSKALLKSVAAALPLCITDDGGLYVDETTPFREATGDDVEVLPATPAAEDAAYFGLAASTFARVDLNITTQGAGTWTITWEYWDGSAWTALSGVTDGTTGFTAATGIVSVTFTLPTDWAKNTVDNVNAYWIRARVSAYTSVTTAPQLGQGWIVGTDASWTDDTTDFTDADAGDVDLLPAYPLVGDGFYIGYTEKFCKVAVTTSQERTGTATITLKYWDGSAWTAVPAAEVEDDTAGWSTTAGALIIHFVPPSDWVSNTATNGPNGETGFFVVMELTALTDVTQQPLATIGTVLPLLTGAEGLPVSGTGFVNNVTATALTASASNADSVFLLVNTTRGTSTKLVWTQADPVESWDLTGDDRLYVQKGEQVALIQITEDGTTEFADAVFSLTIE